MISAPDMTAASPTRTNFAIAINDYTFTLDYIASATANGNDPTAAMPSPATSGGTSPSRPS